MSNNPIGFMGGGRTVRDRIQEQLSSSGLEEAAAVSVLFQSGREELIVSDQNPVLDEPAESVQRVEVTQSAEAGVTVVVYLNHN